MTWHRIGDSSLARTRHALGACTKEKFGRDIEFSVATDFSSLFCHDRDFFVATDFPLRHSTRDYQALDENIVEAHDDHISGVPVTRPSACDQEAFGAQQSGCACTTSLGSRASARTTDLDSAIKGLCRDREKSIATNLSSSQ